MNIPKTFLTEAIDSDSILRILSNKNKQIDKTNQYYNKLASWANTRQLKIKNVDLTKIDLSDRSLIGEEKLINRYNSLGSLLDRLKNLMDQEGRYNPNDAKSKLIQQTTLEILASLSGIKDTNTPPPEEPKEPDNTNLHEGMDWTAEKARRLSEAREAGEAISSVLDKFYNDYYRVEYAGGTDEAIVAKLKSLDKILIPEFNALGYNPDVNPLAQFLKILIRLRAEDKADNIFDRLNTNNYGAIHNAFIAKHITGNMLGNYGTDNILFCKDLYNYRGLDIVNYLSLWKQTYDKADGDDAAKKLFAAKVIINQPNAVGDTYAEKVASLKGLAENVIKLPTSREANLKSELEIQELYRYLFKAAAKKHVNVDEIVNEAKNKQVVLDMIRHILDQDDFKRAYPDDTKETKARLIEIGYKRNEKNIDTCEEILSEYILDVKSEYKILAKLTIAHNQNMKAKKAGANT